MSLTRHGGLVSKEGAVALESALQCGDVDARWRRAGGKRQRRGRTGGLPHGARSARPAAVPAACPMAKQAPLARAADWPSWVIAAQRPATRRLDTLVGTSMR